MGRLVEPEHRVGCCGTHGLPLPGSLTTWTRQLGVEGCTRYRVAFATRAESMHMGGTNHGVRPVSMMHGMLIRGMDRSTPGPDRLRHTYLPTYSRRVPLLPRHTRWVDSGANKACHPCKFVCSLATSLRRPFWLPGGATSSPPRSDDLQPQLVTMVLVAALRTAQLRPLGLSCRRFATALPVRVSRLPPISTHRACVRFATSSTKPAPAPGAAPPLYSE